MIHNYQYLLHILGKAVNELDSRKEPTSLTELTLPQHQQFGDYATNLALKIWKTTSKHTYHSATDCANDLIQAMVKLDQEGRIKKAEVAGPGFINIWINPSYLFDSTEQKATMLPEDEKAKKVLVEFVGANTNKQLHIGHLLNSVLGHALINTMRAAGYNVDAGTINNDRGIHIIKSMYGYLSFARRKNIQINGNDINSLPSQTLSYKKLLTEWIEHPSEWVSPEEIKIKPDHLIGWCYAKGNEIGEKDEAVQEQMQLMLRAWESGDSDVRALWSQTNTWFYEGCHQTLKKLGILASHDQKSFFDITWYESEVYQSGKDIILKNANTGIIKEFDDGHVEAMLEEKYQLPNIVLLRKDKTALYITQDIELLRNRLEDLKYDQVIYVVDYRQTLQFKQLFIIVESLGIPQAKNCKHLAYGEVRTPQGAMSSRKGNIISADWLLEETFRRAYEKINTERNEYSQEDKQHIAHHVALAAIKYGMLKYNPASNIIFDIDVNIAFEGNTGPYLQYTYARTSSILNKHKEQNGVEANIKEVDITNHASEYNLLRFIDRYEVILTEAALNKTPNLICEYLYELAQQFNQFYAEKQILQEEDIGIRKMRLNITKRINNVLAKGLAVLGITAIDRM